MSGVKGEDGVLVGSRGDTWGGSVPRVRPLTLKFVEPLGNYFGLVTVSCPTVFTDVDVGKGFTEAEDERGKGPGSPGH